MKKNSDNLREGIFFDSHCICIEKILHEVAERYYELTDSYQ